MLRVIRVMSPELGLPSLHKVFGEPERPRTPLRRSGFDTPRSQSAVPDASGRNAPRHQGYNPGFGLPALRGLVSLMDQNVARHFDVELARLAARTRLWKVELPPGRFSYARGTQGVAAPRDSGSALIRCMGFFRKLVEKLGYAPSPAVCKTAVLTSDTTTPWESYQ